MDVSRRRTATPRYGLSHAFLFEELEMQLPAVAFEFARNLGIEASSRIRGKERIA